MADQKLHILIIDDDEVDMLAVKRSLKSSGYNVELSYASNLESGLNISTGQYFDCIFLDYSLQGSTGFDFLEKYRVLNGTTPVIMITSLGDEKLAVEAMKKGANDYIPKSLITPEGVSQSMRYILKLKEVNQNTSRVEKALQETEQKLETVISNSPLLLFSIDKDGIFTMFKGHVAQGLIYKPEEIIGRSIFDLDMILPVQLQDYLTACLGKENSFFTKTSDGHFKVHFIPVKNENGELKEMMGTVTDITGMKQTEEGLIKTIAIAEENSRAKEQFLANMSHEIRTPIHGIMSLTDILLKTKFNEEQGTYLQAIKKSADNLLVIINDILDLSKIESGKMTFENTPFDFRELFKMCFELFRHKAQDKNLNLTCDIDEEIPTILKGDPVRLSQIINNLLSNSIKFTEKGSVRLDIRINEKNSSSCIINFKISDTGIGIPAQKLSGIFESFSQAGNDITRKYGGTGLGLSIVKKLTELQAGFITVSSELNSGTTFEINLPFHLTEKEEIKPLLAHQKKPELQLKERLNILVVEDNEINQMIINKLLKDWGVGIDNACNGVEALEKIKTQDYHIVLMDIEMPEMNGYEAARNIRKFIEPQKRNIPILAMTAHATTKEREKCLVAGMNDYISKPFDPSDVKNKIIQLTTTQNVNLDNLSFEKPIDEHQEGLVTAPEFARLTNLDFLKEMSDNNDSFIRDFIQLFLQNAPDSVILMKKYYETKDWESLRQTAHKIKPSFNYIGLKDLHVMVAQIEENSKKGTGLEEIAPMLEKITRTCELACTELKQDLEKLTVS